jgi:hypothetical protein
MPEGYERDTRNKRVYHLILPPCAKRGSERVRFCCGFTNQLSCEGRKIDKEECIACLKV